jgi:hypothetical protein
MTTFKIIAVACDQEDSWRSEVQVRLERKITKEKVETRAKAKYSQRYWLVVTDFLLDIKG